MPRASFFWLPLALLSTIAAAQETQPTSTTTTSQPTTAPSSQASTKPSSTPSVKPNTTPPKTEKAKAEEQTARFDGRKQFHAVRADEPIVLDGILDESSWKSAEARNDFIERSPKPGGSARHQTIVKVLFDDEALYFGIRCEQPTAPRIRVLRRDSGNLFSDDGLSVKIDPYEDHRTTMSFATNAAGAQYDLLTLDNGQDFIDAFDALWEAETSVDSEGYTVEYRIPFRTLGIPGNGKKTSIGIDFERRVTAENENYQWSILPKGVSDNNATFYGDLVGLDDIETGQPLQISPYFVASASSEEGATTTQGLDLKASLGSIGSAQVSFRTDFAQISPDDAFVNLGRFAVALSERRPFFLEGTDIFKFGSGGDQLFFSRRIGIEDDPNGIDSVLVPINLGVKAQGRSGPYSFGVLNVLTGESPGLEEGTVIDPSNYTVVRARRSFGESANGGALVTFKQTLPDDKGLATDGLSLGTDASLRFMNDQLSVNTLFGFTHNNDFVRDEDNQIVFSEDGVPSPFKEDGFSVQAGTSYAGDFASPFFSVSLRTKDYNPAVGFVGRTDTAAASTGIEFSVRPDKKSKVAAYAFGPDSNITTNSTFGQVLDSEVGGFFAIGLKSGFNAFTGGGVGYSFIDEEFSPIDNLLIPSGDYVGYGHSIGISTSNKKDLSLSANFSSNVSRREPDAAISDKILNGSVGFNIFLSARLNRYFSANIGANDDVLFVNTNDGIEETQDKARGNVLTANSGVEVAFNRALSWSTTFQLTDITDLSLISESLETARFFGQGLVQSRLAWRFRPGSDLFLVYNVGQDLAISGEETAPPSQSIALKISVVLEIARK
jgi:hypothetical protein